MIDKINRLLRNPKLSSMNRDALIKMGAEYHAGGGAAGGRPAENLARLRRWMEEMRLNPREEALIAEALKIVRQPDGTYRYGGGAVYKNLGRTVRDSFATGAASGIDSKIRKALDLGVPSRDIDKVLRNNALRSRNAQVRGTLLGAGLSGLGRASANQAGLITQAGLNNQAFTPQAGALDAVGAGIEGAGQAEAGYYDELSRIEEAGEERRLTAEEKKRKKFEASNEKKATYRKQIKLAQEAIKELSKGAGVVINFAVSPTVTKTARAAAIGSIRVGGQGSGNVESLTLEYKTDAINNYFGVTSPALKSYYALRQLANELRVIARQKIAGQGQVTEGEADVVYNTVFGFDQPADTVAHNLQRLLNRAADEIGEEAPQVPYQSIGETTIPEDKLKDIGLDAESLGINIGLGDDDKDKDKDGDGQTDGDTSGDQTGGDTSSTTQTEQTAPPAQPAPAEEKLKGKIVLTKTVEHEAYQFIEIDEKDVPSDVKEANGDRQNAAILGDDGYIYIYHDESNFDITLPKWVKSNLKKKGG